MIPIKPHQVKIIHALKTALGWDDTAYRSYLSAFGVSSSLQFSAPLAQEMIREMERMAEKKGTWKRGSFARAPEQKKYDELGKRPGMATPRQLRYIEGLWASISRQPDAETRAAALGRFLSRIVGISEITWLEPGHVQKIVNAIKHMERS